MLVAFVDISSNLLWESYINPQQSEQLQLFVMNNGELQLINLKSKHVNSCSEGLQGLLQAGDKGGGG